MAPNRESDTELCEHCECIMRNHPCCHCGLWLKDIDPIEVRGTEVTLHPIAMEYGMRYGFRLAGEKLWSYAIRHRDESVQIIREQPKWDFPFPPAEEVEAIVAECVAVETVVEDCRPTKGWLSDGVECGIDTDPRCEHHRRLFPFD